MMEAASEVTRRRRSGAALEAALLEAAWDELAKVGYGRLTMASIAARAGTSEAVLYRRWSNKDQLVLAALEARRDAYPIEIPETGTLRTDLIEQLRILGESMADFYAIAAAASLSGLLADTGKTPSQVREQVMGSTASTSVREVYRRAAERGELDLAQVPRTILEMPFDLLRHDLLMELHAPTAARIRSIVDDLFLPLVATAHPDHYSPAGLHHRSAMKPASPVPMMLTAAKIGTSHAGGATAQTAARMTTTATMRTIGNSARRTGSVVRVKIADDARKNAATSETER